MGKYFKIESAYFMLLQFAFEVNQILINQTAQEHSLEGKIRSIVFWDTDISKINWQKHKRFVIKRMLERGNQKEIKALNNFYGREVIRSEIPKIKDSFLSCYEKNVAQFIS